MMTVAFRRCCMLALLATVSAPSLGGCSGDTVRTLAADAGYGPKKVDAPEFVANSRPKETPDYMAVGVDAPKRPARPRNAEAQKALESELEKVRNRNEAKGHAAESAGKGVARGLTAGGAAAAQ